MNLLRSATIPPASTTNGGPVLVNVYHLHPLVAGPLENWPPTLERVAAMGFSHVCLAPPLEPGESGDIFLHSSFERLHPSLGFGGPADQGIALVTKLAARAGLKVLLDIAPGQVAADAPIRHRHPEWFNAIDDSGAIDPRHKPPRLGVALPRFGQTSVADSIAGWWVEHIARMAESGVAGFRCLTLDVVPASFWRRLVTTFPDMLFIAWTPGVGDLRRFRDVGFGLTCSSAAWWDGKATWFLDEHDVLREIAPALASPEPSFLDRLAHRLPPGIDLPGAYRLALGVAASTGAGLFVPMGFEFLATRRFDSVKAGPSDLPGAVLDGLADLSADVAEAIRLNATLPPFGSLRTLTSPAAPVTAMLRSDALILINPDTVRPAPVGFSLAPLPSAAGDGRSVESGSNPRLRPGEVRVLPTHRTTEALGGGLELARSWAERTRIAVEAVRPGGEYPAKTVVGREIVISADIFGDGHDVLAADVLWRPADSSTWQRMPMAKRANDRWEARVRPDRIGLFWFTVEGWWDQWATFTHDLHAKVDAGQAVSLEIQEGRILVEAALGSCKSELTVEALLSDQLAAAMKQADKRPFAARSTEHTIRVDRPAAEFASWYELFPRSVTTDPSTHGTFRNVMDRLPAIRAMGFDVLYFPPIHPIGRINRKGRNNSLRAEPGDVGSPYAIGAAEGGHDAVHPELGTLDDFRALLQEAKRHDLELAIDFAIQCAPDHPWVTQHKDWFRWRPDGSMRYAENPPKKYEDIVNPDFYGDASFPSVWIALRDVIQFWVDQGVRIFRVDNPHTKPLPFWHWMIADIQSRHPDALFLSEAFTRPKLMYRLAKVGFTQSYTYFTWRNTKQEIIEYLTELTSPPVAEFFRPNFFVNTPDINPVFLQTSGRPGFLIRAALAATLSGLWGVYSGFEVCEAAPLPGREEYLDSEKYEIRPRDYHAPGNIVAEITALNRIRRQHPALQSHLGLQFYPAYNDQVILYGKRDPIDRSMVLVAVNFDPHVVQQATIEVPLWEFDLTDDAGIAVTDLMRGDRFTWFGKYQTIQLDPADLPFRIWRLEVQ